MQKDTYNSIHRTYVKSVEKSKDIMGILENFHDMLCNISDTIPNEDLSQFDTFLNGVYTSKMIRYQTFDMTNLVTDITFAIMYIIKWLNFTQDYHFDIEFNVRRKALESELSKILFKSNSNSMANIHDRFGLRGIIDNPPSEAKELLFFISEYIITVLVRKSRKDYKLFLDWVNNNLDNFTKTKIQFVLDLPFKVYRYKNYVDTPKNTGYQSIHYVIALEMFSPVLPGAELELQWRTLSMHKSSSNDDYEESRRKDEDAVFTIEDFSKVKMVGFTGYSETDDRDGIHYDKKILNRRISPTLV